MPALSPLLSRNAKPEARLNKSQFCAIAFVLVMILTLAIAAPVMADGPSQPGYGKDDTASPGPGTRNLVNVPDKAFDVRGPLPPGNQDNNGAQFVGSQGG